MVPGDTLVESELKIDQPRLWELNDPFLYRVTAQVRAEESGSVDEHSVRCGFRDFRFENGWFRLNGRRLFLRSTLTCNNFPVGLKLPPDPDMARRDLLDLKVMGFNMIRFIWGDAERYQLDLCDELGLMVYQESFASGAMNPSPNLKAWWERSITEMIQRDRNHPSVVVWGLLNEIPDGPQFRAAAASLPLVHQLDDSRMVFFNSGVGETQENQKSREGGLLQVNFWGSQPIPNRLPRSILRPSRSKPPGSSPGRRARWPCIQGPMANTAWCAGRHPQPGAMPSPPSSRA